jgi:radical SAM superfamily enzyme YgiQ (UPF0313 family)
MEKNLLLVWPATDKGFYDFNPLNELFGQKGQFYPLSLLAVAGALGPEWNYRFVDDNITPVNKKHFSGVDYILISVNILQKKSAERIIHLARVLNKPVIAGGPLLSTHDTVFEGLCTRVIGEIEAQDESELENGLSLAETLSRDMKADNLKDTYRAKGHPDITQVRAPRYDLADPGIYFNISLQTSRGCHHSCEFCQEVPLYGRHQRKTVPQVMHELDLLHSSGGNKTVYIIDDNFMGNITRAEEKDKFKQMLLAIQGWQARHDYPFDFFSQCSLELADHEDIVPLMTKIGINILFLGIETLSNQSLALINKKQNINQDQVAKVKKLQSYGMGVAAGLIYGFDGDGGDAIDSQIEFLRKSNIPLAGLSILQAPHGTRLYKRMEEDGRLSKDPEALTKSFRTNIILHTHPRDFYRHYLRFAKTVYGAKEYFDRCLAWITDWNDAYVLPGKRGSIPSNYRVFRLLRSFCIQGVFSSYGLTYWEFLFRSLIRFRSNSNKLALALYLAYFYRVASDVTIKIEQFVDNLPQELVDEWEGRFGRDKPPA